MLEFILFIHCSIIVGDEQITALRTPFASVFLAHSFCPLSPPLSCPTIMPGIRSISYTNTRTSYTDIPGHPIPVCCTRTYRAIRLSCLLQVLETPAMGRMLVLDNALQCAERDEAGYHEFMTHTALCRQGAASGSGKRALIIGGGDGGAAREILRHDDIASVDLVDIDEEVYMST